MRRSGLWTALVLGGRFVTEFALVAGAAWAASTSPRNVLVAIVAGIVAALAVAAIWGVAIAPNARRRLRDPVRLALEIALFVLVALALDVVGHAVPAVVIAVAGVVAAVAVRFVREPAPPETASPTGRRRHRGAPQKPKR